MIPKEIAIQLVQLKEKVKTYSSIQRSLDVQERRDEVDEIKEVVEKANNEIADLTKKVNNILVDELIFNFEIENWIEVIMDKSDFNESNPRIAYEEEQNELEWQRMLKEEKNQKKLKEEQREQKRKKEIAEEKTKREIEEYPIRLKAKRIEEYKNLCYNGPDDLEKIQQLIKDGLDIASDGGIYDLACLDRRGRNIKFIEFLIESGMKIRKHDFEYCLNSKSALNSEHFLKFLISAKNIDQDAVEMAKAALNKQARDQKNILEQENILNKLKEATNGKFNSYYNLFKDGDLESIKKVLSYRGFDLNEKTTIISYGLPIPILTIFAARGIKFIQLLVDSGYFVTKKDIEYFYSNSSKYRHYYKQIIRVLITAENINDDAVEMVNEIRNEDEDFNNYIKQTQQTEFYELCNFNLESDEIDKFRKIIKEGFDINQSDRCPDLSELIKNGRTIEFIECLVIAGMKITKQDVESCLKSKSDYNSVEFLNILASAKNIDQEALEMAKSGLNQKVKDKRILLEQEEKLNKLRSLTHGKFNSFYNFFENGDLEDIRSVLNLSLININQKISKNNSDEKYSILSIFETRSIEFIQLLVDVGYMVTKKEIVYYYDNFPKFPNFKEIIEVLKTAKNIESDALEYIIKRKRAKRNQITILVIVLTVMVGLAYIFFEEIMGFFKIFLIILLLPLLLPIILKKR